MIQSVSDHLYDELEIKQVKINNPIYYEPTYEYGNSVIFNQFALDQIVQRIKLENRFSVKCAKGAFGTVLFVANCGKVRFIKIQHKQFYGRVVDLSGLKPVELKEDGDFSIEYYRPLNIRELRGKKFIDRFIGDLNQIHSEGSQHCDLHPGNINLLGNIIDNGLITKVGDEFHTVNIDLHDGSKVCHNGYDFKSLSKWLPSNNEYVMLGPVLFNIIRKKQVKVYKKIRESINDAIKQIGLSRVQKYRNPDKEINPLEVDPDLETIKSVLDYLDQYEIIFDIGEYRLMSKEGVVTEMKMAAHWKMVDNLNDGTEFFRVKDRDALFNDSTQIKPFKMVIEFSDLEYKHLYGIFLKSSDAELLSYQDCKSLRKIMPDNYYLID
jgi:hypothetical protein